VRLHHARAGLLLALSAALALLGALVVPAPSASAASAGWAALSFSGSANDWAGTLRQRAVGFPEARVVSDSAGGTAVGRQSGASTYLSASTPVGAVYGTSRNQPYLNLRPYTANGSGVPGVSTTTYTFEAPTPASGWTFVLGDVDADAVTVAATGPGGVPVAPADLGFRSVFNYAGGADVPTWDEDSGTLTGNPRALDTDGASAWFEPQVPLETLTLVFARRAGFPVYQAWFASQSHVLTGTVTTSGAPADVREGLTVRLYAPDGRVVEETTTDADGTYRFGGLATYDGYRVALDRPDGYTSDDPLARTVDLSRSDATADFSLRAIVPSAVTGTVRSDDGEPLAGVEVRLTGNGEDRTAVTGADGSYVFDDVAVGEGYRLTATAPKGTTVSAPRTFSVPPDSEAPIEDQDFVVTPQPRGTLGGTVSVEGFRPVPGVLVLVSDADGQERVAISDDDGRWSLDDLPPGAYTVAVQAPTGTAVVGDDSLDATVPAEGGTVDGLDFVLRVTEPPAVFTASGTVRDEAGMAFPDVEVQVRDSSGSVVDTATTDETGAWSVDGLAAEEEWSATVVPPDGYDAVDGDTLDFDGTDATGLDFVLAPETEGGSEPAEGSSGGSGTTTPVLAQTGGPGVALLLVGLGATTGGVLLLRRARLRRE
jgi:hypothetical protein